MEKTYCDNCNKVIGEKDNVFETETGDYICQDCFESRNEMYYNLYHK